HTRSKRDWSSDVCSSDLTNGLRLGKLELNPSLLADRCLVQRRSSCKVAVRQYRGVNVSATGGHLRVQLGIGDIGSRSGESNNCRVGIKFRRRWRLFTADKRQKIKERNILIGTGGGRWFGKLA